MCSENVQGLTERVDNILLKMIDGLKKHPRIGPDVPMIVAIEAMGADAMYLGPKFQKIARDLNVKMCVMREMKSGPDGHGWGVPKANTAALVAATREIMAYNLLSIPSDCMAMSSDFMLPISNLNDCCKKLHSQFTSFKKNSDGSMNGKGGGGNDDMLIGLMMCIFWSQVFCRSDRFEYGDFKAYFSDRWDTWQATMPGSIACNIRTTC